MYNDFLLQIRTGSWTLVLRPARYIDMVRSATCVFRCSIEQMDSRATIGHRNTYIVAYYCIRLKE